MIYNDIDESVYYFKYDEMEFYFSSKFYLDKFKREYQDYLKDETNKLRIKFQCNIEADYLILLLLYKKIEKRGFRVLLDGNRLCKEYFVMSVITN